MKVTLGNTEYEVEIDGKRLTLQREGNTCATLEVSELASLLNDNLDAAYLLERPAKKSSKSDSVKVSIVLFKSGSTMTSNGIGNVYNIVPSRREDGTTDLPFTPEFNWMLSPCKPARFQYLTRNMRVTKSGAFEAMVDDDPDIDYDED